MKFWVLKMSNSGRDKLMLVMLIGVLAAAGIETWMLFHRPCSITPETMRLSEVRWAKVEDIDHLRGRQVIALNFVEGNPIDSPQYCFVEQMELDPAIIQEFVDVLLRVRRGDEGLRFSSGDSNWRGLSPGRAGKCFQFVCSDNTGVNITYFYPAMIEQLPTSLQRDETIYGVGWASRELWTVLMRRNKELAPSPYSASSHEGHAASQPSPWPLPRVRPTKERK